MKFFAPETSFMLSSDDGLWITTRSDWSDLPTLLESPYTWVQCNAPHKGRPPAELANPYIISIEQALAYGPPDGPMAVQGIDKTSLLTIKGRPGPDDIKEIDLDELGDKLRCHFCRLQQKFDDAKAEDADPPIEMKIARDRRPQRAYRETGFAYCHFQLGNFDVEEERELILAFVRAMIHVPRDVCDLMADLYGEFGKMKYADDPDGRLPLEDYPKATITGLSDPTDPRLLVQGFDRANPNPRQERRTERDGSRPDATCNVCAVMPGQYEVTDSSGNVYVVNMDGFIVKAYDPCA